MPLGRQVGLGPGDIVLDEDPAPPAPKGHSPQFSAHVCFGQTAGWINMSLGRKIGFALVSGHLVLHGGPALPPPKGHNPQFSVHVYCMAKRSPISATAEHLLHM